MLQPGVRAEGTDDTINFWEDRGNGVPGTGDPARCRYRKVSRDGANVRPSLYARYEASREIVVRTENPSRCTGVRT